MGLAPLRHPRYRVSVLVSLSDLQLVPVVGPSLLAQTISKQDDTEGEVMGKKLYVGNLAFATTSADLETLFAQVGTCESAAVITDRDTGRSRGFGFVEMSSASEAAKAIAELNGKDLQGRQLNVSEAKERSGGDRPRGRY